MTKRPVSTVSPLRPKPNSSACSAHSSDSDHRYTAVPHAGLGWTERARETVLEWRLAEERRSGLVFGLDAEGARREAANDGGAEHRLGLRMSARW